MEAAKTDLKARGLYNCISCNRPKIVDSYPGKDIFAPCLKCLEIERNSQKRTRTCLRCNKKFTTRNKAYFICFPCKDSPDFRDHCDAGGEWVG